VEFECTRVWRGKKSCGYDVRRWSQTFLSKRNLSKRWTYYRGNGEPYESRPNLCRRAFEEFLSEECVEGIRDSRWREREVSCQRGKPDDGRPAFSKRLEPQRLRRDGAG